MIERMPDGHGRILPVRAVVPYGKGRKRAVRGRGAGAIQAESLGRVCPRRWSSTPSTLLRHRVCNCCVDAVSPLRSASKSHQPVAPPHERTEDVPSLERGVPRDDSPRPTAGGDPLLSSATADGQPILVGANGRIFKALAARAFHLCRILMANMGDSTLHPR